MKRFTVCLKRAYSWDLWMGLCHHNAPFSLLFSVVCYQAFCHEKECARGNENDCSPAIFFRVINEIRCLGYLQ
jgi:hypothetical protein